MSKQAAVGLAIARYGLYLVLFASHAVGQRVLPQDRLILLAALLLALAAVGYILTEHCRSQRLALALMGLEIGLIFAIGVVTGGGWFRILYFVVVGEAFFFATAPRAVAVALAAYVTMGANFALSTPPVSVSEFAEDMLFMLTGFVFFGAASRLAVEQMKARTRTDHLLKEVEDAHTRLQAYALEVETLSVARERQRLAQEVHDAVAHVLTGLLVQLQAVRRLLKTDPGSASARLSAMEEAARRGLDEVRRAVRAMRPEHLEAVGGIEAMRRLCDQFAERSGIRVNFVTEEDPQLSPAHEVLLYRTLQECLTNAARHGRASTIWAHLRAENGGAELRVRDDGVGAEHVQPGMGLGGMQERAHATGGRFSFITAPGEGFEAVLDLPREAVAPVNR
jgi:signal transduction histidine kinase